MRVLDVFVVSRAQKCQFPGTRQKLCPTMSETPKRLAPTKETLRELYLKSGNLCMFPGCAERIMDKDGKFVGQISHIEAAEPRGERFNPSR